MILQVSRVLLVKAVPRVRLVARVQLVNRAHKDHVAILANKVLRGRQDFLVLLATQVTKDGLARSAFRVIQDRLAHKETLEQLDLKDFEVS